VWHAARKWKLTKRSRAGVFRSGQSQLVKTIKVWMNEMWIFGIPLQKLLFNHLLPPSNSKADEQQISRRLLCKSMPKSTLKLLDTFQTIKSGYAQG
jgi:hypothetical protein